MPKWLHRTTKQLLRSVPSGELPEPQANYIEEPDLSAVLSFPSKYWKIAGNNILLMSTPERAAVDAAEETARRDSTANELDQLENILRAFALVVLDEFNVLRAQHGLPQRTIAQLKNALRNKLGS